MALKRKFATRQSLIGGGSQYRPWKEWKEGEYVVGIFQGTKSDNFGNTSCIVKVVEADFLNTDLATAMVDQTLTLNSCGSLQYALEKMEKGAAYKFEYKGKVILAKGKFSGKESHSVSIDEVDLDDSEIVEVNDEPEL